MRELHHSTGTHDPRPAARAQGADARVAPALRRQLRQERLEARRRHGEAQLVVIAAAEREPARLAPRRAPRAAARTPAAPRDPAPPPRRSPPQACRASPSRPSETSMQALACRAAPRPARRAGSGTGSARAGRHAPRPGLARRACSSARPAAASPGQPDTNSASPACAPLRLSAVPVGTSPSSCTVMHSGPRVVSPPTSATRCSRASALRPAANSPSHDSCASGSVSASSAHAGRAPIAARSLRFTARAR